MKTLIKLFSTLILSVGLANCGSSDLNSGSAPAPKSGVGDSVQKVDYTNGAKKVSYTSGGTTTDFYNTYTNGSKKCLAKTADDKSVGEIYAQLMAYLNSGVAGKGTLDIVGANPRYIKITYANGSQKTFNLNNASASKTEDVLSNGAEISAYLDSLHTDINDNPNSGNCLVGKKKY